MTAASHIPILDADKIKNLTDLYHQELSIEPNRLVAANRTLDRFLSHSALVGVSLEEERRLISLLLDNAKVATILPQTNRLTSAKILQLAQKLSAEIVRRGDYSETTADDAINRENLANRIRALIDEQGLSLNAQEIDQLVVSTLNEMLGFGPLEELLADQSISDIMVNGPNAVFFERKGRIEESSIRFTSEDHILRIATRIVSTAGRRIDESSPLVDARMPDGSRINVIIPPLALDSPTITIRKFPSENLSLGNLVQKGSLSPDMANYLRIAAICRLNMVISGGTGSGKTTLLNAISREASNSERIVTIEDTAELRLQQRHVVRLETRPPSLDGTGEIGMRALLKNALRMRPDRIIVGEVRGAEAVDLLQAMNTGHDGSLSTLHANSPREAVTRLANLVALTGVAIAQEMLMNQIRDAVQVFVQVARMNDGVRRVVSIAEVVGTEPGMVTMQEVLHFAHADERHTGVRRGFQSNGVPSVFVNRAAAYGVEAELRGLLSR